MGCYHFQLSVFPDSLLNSSGWFRKGGQCQKVRQTGSEVAHLFWAAEIISLEESETGDSDMECWSPVPRADWDSERARSYILGEHLNARKWNLLLLGLRFFKSLGFRVLLIFFMETALKFFRLNSEKVGKWPKYQLLSACKSIFFSALGLTPRVRHACDTERLFICQSQCFLGLQYQTQSNIFSSRLCH